MKFSVLLTAFALTAGTGFAQLKTPAPSPSQTIKQAFGLSEITLEYSRPGVKGRKIFGDLVPYNKIWRTGANASTKITFNDDVTFGGKPVKAGTYAIYTIPKEGNWDVMLYSDATLAGNVANYDPAKEVVRVSGKATRISNKMETLNMQFQNITDNTMEWELRWENMKVTVPVTTEIDSKIMKSIENNVVKDNRPYYQAASYYYSNNKDLNQALTWVNKALEQNPAAFYMYALKARIQLKQNNKTEAAATAREVIKYATEAKSDDYVKIGNDLLKQAKK